MNRAFLFALAFGLCVLLPRSANAAVRLLDYQPNPHWHDQLIEQSAQLATNTLMQRQAEGTAGCARYCEPLGRIFQRLIEVARSQTPDADAIPWSLVVTRKADEDAWAIADGHIFISEAFIEREQLNEQELAFVLAHEISHVLYHDEADMLDLATTVVPMGVSASVEDIYATMDVDIHLLLRLAPFMSEQELQADRTGLMLAALAGYDPARGIGYIRRLAHASGERPIVATHPPGAQRLQSLLGALPMAERVYARSAALRSQAPQE